MHILKLLARRYFFPLVTWLHIDYFLGKLQPNRQLILCFHGVSKTTNFSINNRHMPAEAFEKLVIYLKKRYDIVGIDEIFQDPIKGGKRRICLTFDDGYLNNYTTVLPILEKYTIPAAFYIITQSIHDSGYELWADQMDLLIKASAGAPIQLGEHQFIQSGKGYVCPSLNGISITNHLKKLGYEKYDLLQHAYQLVPGYEEVKKSNPTYTKLMNAEELKRFSESSLIQIGSHTVWHLNLSETSDTDVEKELRESKETLEHLLGKPVNSIAYPDGSYDQRVIDLAEKCGYTQQLAVVFSDPDRNSKDHRIRPRISVSNSTTVHSNIFRINLSFGKQGF